MWPTQLRYPKILQRKKEEEGDSIEKNGSLNISHVYSMPPRIVAANPLLLCAGNLKKFSHINSFHQAPCCKRRLDAFKQQCRIE